MKKIKIITLGKVLLSMICVFILGVGVGMAYKYAKLSKRVSNADHGKTFAEVVEGISVESYEYHVEFINGVKVYETTDYSDHSVKYQRAKGLSEDDYCIDIHNHPTIYPGVECSFSYPDLMTACRSDRAMFDQYIVVTSDYLHILEAPNGWPAQDAIVSYFIDHYNMSFGSGESVRSGCSVTDQQLIRLCDEGKFYVSEEETGQGIAFTPAMVAELADYLGLVYTIQTHNGTVVDFTEFVNPDTSDAADFSYLDLPDGDKFQPWIW